VSQRSVILDALRIAGRQGVCLSDVPLEIGYTMRNRVAELRRDGKLIESERCRVHKHASTVSRYFLIERSAFKPSQPQVFCNVDHQGEPCSWKQPALAL
jgi:hypothetical protein